MIGFVVFLLSGFFNQFVDQAYWPVFRTDLLADLLTGFVNPFWVGLVYFRRLDLLANSLTIFVGLCFLARFVGQFGGRIFWRIFPQTALTLEGFLLRFL